MGKSTNAARKVVAALAYAHNVQGQLAANHYAFSMAARFRVSPLKGGILGKFTTK